LPEFVRLLVLNYPYPTLRGINERNSEWFLSIHQSFQGSGELQRL
jgi:hypothetical protein